MPSYELAILFRALAKDKLAEAMKTTAGLIFEEGGIIRKLNNLGLQPTPYKMRSHGQWFKQANYFVYEFDIPASSVSNLKNELQKREFIVRNLIFSPVTPISPEECLLEEEMQIAPFRKDVQMMLKKAKENEAERMRSKVKPNHGLDFEPLPL
ncbi:hypothetical protein ONE63_000385 [Megalurothrips usitatus]|uniref:Small ribosomal subunit protein bS6m n=1 Tax=Megalurothrips usitatus TaxID=439358 RepID=A0AAV7XYA0_9NEOP|nr:hypothetical protein ONE63_000385 [Megalurothrips usitatus]